VHEELQQLRSDVDSRSQLTWETKGRFVRVQDLLDHQESISCNADLAFYLEEPISWEEAKVDMERPDVFTEFKDRPPGNKSIYARQLTLLLRTTGKHKFHTLPFCSFSEDPSGLRYAFLFDFPPGAGARSEFNPQSLWKAISEGVEFDFEHRLHVAQTLARAVGAFHADGWLHKCIRSHSIKFFKDGKTGEYDYSTPYLTEFESSRPEGLATITPSDQTRSRQNVEWDLYRDPEMNDARQRFSKPHDIFSVGVVLLEIGVWRTAGTIYNVAKKQWLEQDPNRGPMPAAEVKRAFTQLAHKNLGHKIGTAYKEAVVNCLDGKLSEYDGTGTERFQDAYSGLVLRKVRVGM
jgi:hypothetical protein